MSVSSIVVGCSVAVVSSAIQSLGITLQRKSHLLPIHITEEGPLDDEELRPQDYHHNVYKRKKNMWLLGFFLFIVSNILGSLIQITTLPLIILSPLQSIGLIFNSLLSCALLPGEVFTWKLGVGTIVISVGAFIIAYNGNATAPPPELNEDVNKRFALILTKLSRPWFLVWFVGTFMIIGVLLLCNWVLTCRKDHLNKKLEIRQSRSIIRHITKLQFIKGINFGLISGTLTAHTFLFAKSLVDVIFQTIVNESHSLQNITKNLTPYFLLFVMLAIVGCQLTAFNLGLAQISTAILYPLCFLVYNLINLINDLMFNDLIQKHIMTWGQLLWVGVGLTSVLWGVILISWDSAVGSTGSQFHGITTEDDYILHLKFPYNDINESTTLLPESPGYEMETNYFTNDSNQLTPHSIYPLSKPNHKPKKRILSFEQQHLLNQLDMAP